jgi:hypothetical protein
MLPIGRGATKALVEATTHIRAPRIETVFMVKAMVRMCFYERYCVMLDVKDSKDRMFVVFKMMEQMLPRPSIVSPEARKKKKSR